MKSSVTNIPLTLYIHMPWCVRKCPYCDFNSHALRDELPEMDYINALIADLDESLRTISPRPLRAIFFGGGTPSLFSPDAIHTLLEQVSQRLPFSPDIEITLEANPGTVEQARFQGYRGAGVNRLSIGIQSFNETQLQQLGRIHDSAQAEKAIDAAHNAGFDNFNIDIMFGLPKQTVNEALADLEHALSFNTTHLSWYQLTLEPHTPFHHNPPPLPMDETIWEIQQQGQALLSEHGFKQYEVSAYAQSNQQCQHNLNYWFFGDYLGIGAGAHGKLTSDGCIKRTWKTKHPNAFLDNAQAFIAGEKILTPDELPLEFMMNALRLNQPIAFELFEQCTRLSRDVLATVLNTAVGQGLMTVTDDTFETTSNGKRYLNSLLELWV